MWIRLLLCLVFAMSLAGHKTASADFRGEAAVSPMSWPLMAFRPSPHDPRREIVGHEASIRPDQDVALTADPNMLVAVARQANKDACSFLEDLKAEDAGAAMWPEDRHRLAMLNTDLGCGMQAENDGSSGAQAALVPVRYRGGMARSRSYSSSRSYNYSSRSRSTYSRSSSTRRASSTARARSIRPVRISPPVRSIRPPARLSRPAARPISRVTPRSVSRMARPAQRMARPGLRPVARTGLRAAPRRMFKAAPARSVRTMARPGRAATTLRRPAIRSARSFAKPRAMKTVRPKAMMGKSRMGARLATPSRMLKARPMGARVSKASLSSRRAMSPSRAARPGATARTAMSGKLARSPKALNKFAKRGMVGKVGTRANMKPALKPKQAIAQRRTANKAANRPVSCSFHGDTLVLTKNGFEAIRDIDVGEDLVWSRNEETGEMAWKRVVGTTSDPYDETIFVRIRDASSGAEQVILSNRTHPFYVKGKNWVRAENLKVGDGLLNGDESYSEVASVRTEMTPIDAYNLTVADFHSYFVRGVEGNAKPVWVHNAKSCPINLDRGARNSLKKLEAGKGHVVDRHVGKKVSSLRQRVAGGAGTATSFKNAQTAKRVIDKGLNSRQFKDWVKGGAKGEIALSVKSGKGVGYGVKKGVLNKGGQLKVKKNIKNSTVLVRSDGRGGYYVHTAYPTY
ncbi:MAG: hypothetical protein KDA53_15110 [Hyphomonas sp.]|nr:hypothetical protein [Hyphomonas sp.]